MAGNLGNHGKGSAALACIECIREGTPDIFIIQRERKMTDKDWAVQSLVMAKHKEEAHGKQ